MSEEETTELDQVDAGETEAEQPCKLSGLERQHYEEIKTLERKAVESEDVYLDARSDAKAAKEVWERDVERLRALIRQGPDPQQQLPFTDDDELADQWKETPVVDVLKLTPKQIETLSAAGVINVGQFEHLRSGQNPDYPDGLLSLPRVGQTTIDKWEEQVVEWLAANAREAVPDDEEGDD